MRSWTRCGSVWGEWRGESWRTSPSNRWSVPEQEIRLQMTSQIPMKVARFETVKKLIRYTEAYINSSPSREAGGRRRGGEGGGGLSVAAAAVDRSDYSNDRILSSRVSGCARSASGYATERSTQHANVHSTIRLSQSSGCANTSLPVRLGNCPTVAPSVPMEWSPRDIFLDSLNSLDSNNCWLQGNDIIAYKYCNTPAILCIHVIPMGNFVVTCRGV